jgi:hypothetical protein
MVVLQTAGFRQETMLTTLFFDGSCGLRDHNKPEKIVIFLMG